ncbi:hypothetical protein [Pseudonocardia alni]
MQRPVHQARRQGHRAAGAVEHGVADRGPVAGGVVDRAEEQQVQRRPVR